MDAPGTTAASSAASCVPRASPRPRAAAVARCQAPQPGTPARHAVASLGYCPTGIASVRSPGAGWPPVSRCRGQHAVRPCSAGIRHPVEFPRGVGLNDAPRLRREGTPGAATGGPPQPYRSRRRLQRRGAAVASLRGTTAECRIRPLTRSRGGPSGPVVRAARCPGRVRRGGLDIFRVLLQER